MLTFSQCSIEPSVTDRERHTIRFGFQVIQSSQLIDDCGWAWPRLNDAELMLNAACERESRPPSPGPARIAVHEEMALFFGRRDVDAA